MGRRRELNISKGSSAAGGCWLKRDCMGLQLSCGTVKTQAASPPQPNHFNLKREGRGYEDYCLQGTIFTITTHSTISARSKARETKGVHSGSSSKLFTVATGLDVSPVASEDTDFIGGMAGWVLWKLKREFIISTRSGLCM